MSFKNDLVSVDPSKKCLSFLADRILDVNYRGNQISQHNRYDLKLIFTLLKEMFLIVGTSKMIIRTTDLSKREYNTPDEYKYIFWIWMAFTCIIFITYYY